MRWIRNELRGVFGVRSKHVIYDIGTEFLYQTCFGHNSTQKASPEELQVGIFTKLSEYSEFAIKTRFPKIGFFAQKAPTGIFNDLFLIYITANTLSFHSIWFHLILFILWLVYIIIICLFHFIVFTPVHNRERFTLVHNRERFTPIHNWAKTDGGTPL